MSRPLLPRSATAFARRSAASQARSRQPICASTVSAGLQQRGLDVAGGLGAVGAADALDAGAIRPSTFTSSCRKLVPPIVELAIQEARQLCRCPKGWAMTQVPSIAQSPAESIPCLNVKLLGDPEFRCSTGPLTLSTSCRAILANLVLQDGHRSKRSRLMLDIAPDAAPGSARRRLNTAVWRLKRAVDPDGVFTPPRGQGIGG